MDLGVCCWSLGETKFGALRAHFPETQGNESRTNFLSVSACRKERETVEMPVNVSLKTLFFDFFYYPQRIVPQLIDSVLVAAHCNSLSCDATPQNFSLCKLIDTVVSTTNQINVAFNEDLPSKELTFVLSDGRVNGYFEKPRKSQRKFTDFRSILHNIFTGFQRYLKCLRRNRVSQRLIKSQRKVVDQAHRIDQK